MATARIYVMEERTGYRTRKPRDATLPYGCITDIAKDVLHNIRRAALGARAKDFLNYTAVLSFGDAGHARKRGASEPGLTCPFLLGAWADELGWHKSDVLRTRKQIVSLNILSFEADEARPGEGTLRWNVVFETWRALDPEYRRARYARPNAGRKKRGEQQASVGDLNSGGEQSPVGNLNTSNKQTGVGDLIHSNQASVSSLNTQNNSNSLRKRIKLPTDASSEPGNGQARDDALIKNNISPYGDIEETVTNVTARSAVRADVSGAEKNNQNDNESSSPLQAEVDVAPSPASARPFPKRAARERKMSDEEIAYCQELMDRIKPLRRPSSVIRHTVEWMACRRCYGLSPRPTIDQLEQLYTLEITRPAWDARSLDIAHLPPLVAPFLGDPDAYAARAQRERKGANGEYEAKPSARAAPSAGKAPAFKRATSPWDSPSAT